MTQNNYNEWVVVCGRLSTGFIIYKSDNYVDALAKKNELKNHNIPSEVMPIVEFIKENWGWEEIDK